MDTSKTSGSLKTPMYGEPFDENKFEYCANYGYYIYLPPNIVNITELYPGLTIVLQFYVDVSLYEGHEAMAIDSMGHTGEQEWDEYQFNYVDRSVYKAEYMVKSGNVSILRKYETNNFKGILSSSANFLYVKELILLSSETYLLSKSEVPFPYRPVN